MPEALEVYNPPAPPPTLSAPPPHRVQGERSLINAAFIFCMISWWMSWMKLHKAGGHRCLRQHRRVVTYLNMSPRPLRTPFLPLLLSLSLSFSFSISSFFFPPPPVFSRSFCLSSFERWPLTPGPAMSSPLVDIDSRPDLELPSVSSSTRTQLERWKRWQMKKPPLSMQTNK